MTEGLFGTPPKPGAAWRRWQRFRWGPSGRHSQWSARRPALATGVGVGPPHAPCTLWARGHTVVTRGHTVVTRGRTVVTRGHTVATRGRTVCKSRLTLE